MLWLLLLLALPAVVQAQFDYTTNNGAITITGYTGPGGAVAIPDTINGLPATSIGDYAFHDHPSLISVTIPNGVTSIGNYAFASCRSLTSVTIGNSVTSIGCAAFYYCTSLTSVTIPDSVTSIGVGALSSCTSLTSVRIPNSVTSIGDSAFAGCTSLSAITVDALNSVYSSIDGVLFDKSQTALIQCPGGKAGSYTIPTSVARIEGYAFYSCTSLTSVTIPDSVTSIEYYTFAYCTSLTNVTIPNSVTSIGDLAFNGCSSLTSVTIGNGVTSIGEHALSYCSSLSAITVDALNSFYSSVDGVLFNKSQTLLIQCPGGKAGSYTIPSSVTSIGDSAFAGCTSLTNVTIPDSVTLIGNSAFSFCTSLIAITVDSLNSFYSSVDGVLFDKSQTLLLQCPGGKAGIYTIPESVTSIDNYAFSSCTSLIAIAVDALNSSYSSVDGVLFNKSQTLLLQCPGGKAGSYTIPSSVTFIGFYAFSYCANLTSVTIPKSVTGIGFDAFCYCSSLTGVYFQGNPPDFRDRAFFGAGNATVYYLPGTTAWETTFAGRPAVLWNPLVVTGDASFGVRTNRFGFTITGVSNLVIVVEASTNLANSAWIPVGTNTLTGGASYFSDPQWTNYPARFYRLRSP